MTTESVSTLFARWQAANSRASNAGDDAEGDAAIQEAVEIEFLMICRPATTLNEVDYKLQVFEDYLHVGEPSDNRDHLMLAAIRADIRTIGYRA